MQERKQDEAILFSNDTLRYLTEVPFPDTVGMSNNMSSFHIISWGLCWAQIQQKYKRKFIHKGGNNAKLAAMVFTVPAVITSRDILKQNLVYSSQTAWTQVLFWKLILQNL